MRILKTGVKTRLNKLNKIKVSSPYYKTPFDKPISSEYSKYIDKTLNDLFLSFAPTV